MNTSFYKYSGSGNDFILFNSIGAKSPKITPTLIRNWCSRREGIGADGVILISPAKSDENDYSLRIWNADGSEAEMCGNAARSSVHFVGTELKLKGTDKEFNFETMNGSYSGQFDGQEVKVKMTELYDVDAVSVSDLTSKEGMYLNTGVPHAVLQVNSVEDVNVESLGKIIRNDVRFPQGTNVDFFEVIDDTNQIIKLRVYERGVEAETLCCGTGIIATAVTCAKKFGWQGEVKVHAKGGLLKAIVSKDLEDLYFQGAVKLVYQGSLTDGQ